MPTRLRGAAFRPQTACGPGNARSGARGLQGGAAGVGEYRGGGVRPRTAAGSEGPAGGASLPGPAEKAGTARPNTPFAARREVLRWAARPRGSGGRCAGTPPPCSPSAVRPGARRRPPARRGLTGPGPRSRPPAVPFSGPQRAGGRGLGRTDTAEGPGYLGGCWWLGSFPSRRGASGRGRGVQAQWDRAGAVGRDPGGQRAGRGGAEALAAAAKVEAPAPAAPSGSSSGRSKMAALPAQGFLSPSQWAGPQKKREEDARAAGGARKRVAGAWPASHTPSPNLLAGLAATPRRPAPRPWRLKGAEERADAQAQ